MLEQLRLFGRSRPLAPEGFRPLRKLGEGGMGVVYEALDLALDRRVAIKRMRDDLAADQKSKAMLFEEARTVARLKHPNIVEIFSLIESPAGLFLVFELVEGKTLDRVMDPSLGLAPETAVGLLRQIASALDHAHAQGIVHQDLKPSNIMVAKGLVKIMDFGIARRVEDLASAGPAAERGTRAYMAPELEHGQIAKQSDLYSLGVCLYEMLCGQRPFANASNYFVKIERNFRPVTELAPALPSSLDEVFWTALHPAPSFRFASATAFLKEVERALA